MTYFQNGSDCEEAVKACEKGLERAPEKNKDRILEGLRKAGL
jgi:hypothetical protein